MNYHPKHKSNSRTAVWIGAGVLAAVAIGAIIFISITLRTPRRCLRRDCHAAVAGGHECDRRKRRVCGRVGYLIYRIFERSF